MPGRGLRDDPKGPTVTWNRYYQGDGEPRDVALPVPPPWRTFPRAAGAGGRLFQPPEGLVEAVNAALTLARPLLVTGPPGSGKSTLIESVASELKLGPVLRWHITSRSTLADALYRYDVLGRIHAQQFAQTTGRPTRDNIADFLQLGPLGAALASSSRPRALLIDELDKSDLDLPSDLLDVLERGEFEIPELVRHDDQRLLIRERDTATEHLVERGRVQCSTFPFIVMTSNGERTFPAPFLRRCVRFRMPQLDRHMLAQIVRAHLGPADDEVEALIAAFDRDLRAGKVVATDQLLNAVFLLTGDASPTGGDRARLADLLLQELSDA
jgi:MoxR-like ATPase